MTFLSDMEKIAGLMDKRLDHIVSASLLDVSTDIIERTPVRHGTAKGGWIPTLDMMSKDRGSPDPTGAAAIANSASKSGQAFGRVFYLVNNVPYVRYLEHGSSDQAPSGMVGISVRNFQRAVRQAVAGARSIG